MGRPRIPAKQRKTKQVGVRFTTAEARKIHRAAKMAGQNAGAWLREVVIRLIAQIAVGEHVARSNEHGYRETRYAYRKLKDGRLQHPLTKEVFTHEQLQKQGHYLTFK